jgi:hypothetical protein
MSSNIRPSFASATSVKTLAHLEKAFWIYTLDERGVEVYDRVEYSGPTAVVLPAKEESCSKALKTSLRRRWKKLFRATPLFES